MKRTGIKQKLIGIVVVVILAGLFVEILLAPSGEKLVSMKYFAMALFAACNLLGSLFSNLDISVLPKELLDQYAEDEDYVLSKNRVKTGTGMMIAGGIMAGVPIIILCIKTSVEGIFALSLIVGIIVFIIGMMIANKGGDYKIEITEEMQQKYQLDLEESKISRICNILAWPAFIAWLILFIISH